MLLFFVRLCNSFVNEPYSCSIDALARLFSLNQADVWLCARAVGWFYLAVHPAGSLPCSPRCNAGVCFVTKCEYVPCSLTICRSEYLSSSKQFLSRRRFSCSYPHFFSFLLQIFLPFFLSILNLSILILYILGGHWCPLQMSPFCPLLTGHWCPLRLNFQGAIIQDVVDIRFIQSLLLPVNKSTVL